ncbi:MAG: hypothetical protein K2N91_00755 [Muribaculaceae bacterium]|nr:hypothetical protein [Muribaculaceae bacterium]
MNDRSSTDKSSDVSGILTLEETAGVKNISELWILAKIVKDAAGDPVWDVLNRSGCRPAPAGDLGYSFDYGGFKGLYVQDKKRRGLISLALTSLADVSNLPRGEADCLINLANSMVTEGKFMLMRDGVWLLHECRLSDKENYDSTVMRILESLKHGAEIFVSLRKM